MSCLQVKVNIFPIKINPTASLCCNVGNLFNPLFVEEGYLFVEKNGVISFLTVDKETIR